MTFHISMKQKCAFYILPVVIFYLQTSILEQGVDALFPKKQEETRKS